MKSLLLALLLCVPVAAQETRRSSGDYSPPVSRYLAGTAEYHADMVRLGWTPKTHPTTGEIYYSHTDPRNIIQDSPAAGSPAAHPSSVAEVSRPAVPFQARPSTRLVPVSGWQSAPASSPRGATEPDISALFDRADKVLQTATRVAEGCSGGS